VVVVGSEIWETRVGKKSVSRDKNIPDPATPPPKYHIPSNSTAIKKLSFFAQCWEKARQGGERGEVNFCDHNGLNMHTMRVTWEAKNQLKELLVGCGFPKECFLPLEYNFAGSDPMLDMVVALLAMGKEDYNGMVSWGSLRSASCPRSTTLLGPIPCWTWSLPS
jgi:hypothetical protein